jgi:glutathionylspermidine synthase
MNSLTAPIAHKNLFTTSPWYVGEPIDEKSFSKIKRHLMLHCCKWDPQVGDVSTLVPFPLVLKSDVWNYLTSSAEQLTAELLSAEVEILEKSELLTQLSLPKELNKILNEATLNSLSPSAARVMRFDFHLTTDGWKISEVNSDVPGGFTESSSFTQMVSEFYPDTSIPGLPIECWVNAIKKQVAPRGVIGLLSAPGYMEDHQIMAYLSKHLQSENFRTHFISPEKIEWFGGKAHLRSAWHHGPLDAIIRFYQGEWIASLSTSYEWSHFFVDGVTPIGNPGVAIIPESKRFPLVWDSLSTPLSAWKNFLPETHDPRTVAWESDNDWILKTAYCNTGDTVSIRPLMKEDQWKKISRDVLRNPQQWVAQKRFSSIPIETPMGNLYPCIGVYTVDGKAAGAYARVSPTPLINFSAMDIALLIHKDE